LLRLVGARALLGHDRTNDHLMQCGHYRPPFFLGVGFFAERVADFLAPVFFGAAFFVALAFFAALAAFFVAFAAFFVAFAAFFVALAVAGRVLRAAGSAAGSALTSGSTPVSAASSITTLSDQRM